jgi:hypothetical protein
MMEFDRLRTDRFSLSGLLFLVVDAFHASTVCTMSLVTFSDLFSVSSVLRVAQ